MLYCYSPGTNAGNVKDAFQVGLHHCVGLGVNGAVGGEVAIQRGLLSTRGPPLGRIPPDRPAVPPGTPSAKTVLEPMLCVHILQNGGEGGCSQPCVECWEMLLPQDQEETQGQPKRDF
jgi:hypothetical protein